MVRNQGWANGLHSADGLKRFRAPAIKLARQTREANFEKRIAVKSNSRGWKYPNRTYDSHLRIRNWITGW